MNIGIIGAGNIGGNLGRRWSAAGHSVRFGVRDPGKLKDLLAQCPGASAGDARSAAAHGEVVVLALPWATVSAVLAEIGSSLKGKIIVDATNALKWTDGPEPALDTSAAQKIAEACPDARVVKAFNTLGAEHILDPKVGGTSADVFLCADDDAARAAVKTLAEQIGFRAVDLGPLRNARLAEHIAIAWIHLAMKAGLGRNIAFKVVGG